MLTMLIGRIRVVNATGVYAARYFMGSTVDEVLAKANAEFYGMPGRIDDMSIYDWETIEIVIKKSFKQEVSDSDDA